MGAKTSNDAMVSQKAQRIGAMQKYVTSSKTEIPVGGSVLKPADVVAVFQEDADNRTEVNTTRAAYRAAVAKRSALTLRRQVTDEALKGWVLNRFGESSAVAKEFGYAPRKRSVVTAEKRANAVRLNHATRKARGTLGKKERLAITGVLPSAGSAATAATVAGSTTTATPDWPAASGGATNS